MEPNERLLHLHHSGHEDPPYWKRVHHDWHFWVAVFFIFTALFIYVVSDDLSLVNTGQPGKLPAAVGRVP